MVCWTRVVHGIPLVHPHPPPPPQITMRTFSPITFAPSSWEPNKPSLAFPRIHGICHVPFVFNAGEQGFALLRLCHLFMVFLLPRPIRSAGVAVLSKRKDR